MLWLSDNDEKRIAHKVSKGDKQAMRELYSLVAGCMSSACCRYLPNDDEAKDVMQDSFLKVITHIDKFRYKGKGSLKAWATRIAINQAISHIRQRQKQRLILIDENHTDIFSEKTADSYDDDNDENLDIYDIDSDILHSFIRSLPDGYRTVFNLYAIERKSHREIANLLNIKESTSASQYHRAKALLAKKIKKHLS